MDNKAKDGSSGLRLFALKYNLSSMSQIKMVGRKNEFYMLSSDFCTHTSPVLFNGNIYKQKQELSWAWWNMPIIPVLGRGGSKIRSQPLLITSLGPA